MCVLTYAMRCCAVPCFPFVQACVGGSELVQAAYGEGARQVRRVQGSGSGSNQVVFW
jgi:hypothetical protein